LNLNLPRLGFLATLLACACSAGHMDVVHLSPNSLQLGMVAHWSCDQEGSVTLADNSGNGHDGMVDGATLIEGHFGGALHFDTGNSVTVPAFPQATRSFSVALWFRAPLSDFDDAYLGLVGNENPSVGGWEMSVKLSPSDLAYRFGYPFGGDAGMSYQHYQTEHVDLERWVHLAAIVDGDTMRLSFFKNAELVGDAELAGPIQTGNSNLLLGRWANDGRMLVGDVDDIVIFNRALVAAEVALLYAEPAPLPQ
jgi:Concanavalin A-like lectin/glucanases superfamily